LGSVYAFRNCIETYSATDALLASAERRCVNAMHEIELRREIQARRQGSAAGKVIEATASEQLPSPAIGAVPQPSSVDS
jgi:hypothetical protein